MLKSFRAYLAAHRRVRIALIVVLVLFAALLVLHPKGTKTYLIMGMDNYGSLDDVGRSDVMMLVQIDFTRSRIATVTFARDMFLDKDGRETKINTIVRSSDEDTLVKTLEENFALDIDGWFRVNFTSVIELVDAVGGVDVELTAEEARYIDRTLGVYPDSPLSEGLCHLNGGQALCFARCRKLDNDMMRGQRQSKVMSAMVQSAKHMSIAQIGSVYNSLKHAWRSSLSSTQQVGLLMRALWLRGAKVTSIGMPLDDWRYGNSKKGESGVLINFETNTALLHEALGLPAVTPEPEN